MAPTVPKKYSGQWIAWNHDRTRILGSGVTLREARKAISTSGEKDPVFAKVPLKDVRFIGRA